VRGRFWRHNRSRASTRRERPNRACMQQSAGSSASNSFANESCKPPRLPQRRSFTIRHGHDVNGRIANCYCLLRFAKRAASQRNRNKSGACICPRTWPPTPLAARRTRAQDQDDRREGPGSSQAECCGQDTDSTWVLSVKPWNCGLLWFGWVCKWTGDAAAGLVLRAHADGRNQCHGWADGVSATPSCEPLALHPAGEFGHHTCRFPVISTLFPDTPSNDRFLGLGSRSVTVAFARVGHRDGGLRCTAGPSQRSLDFSNGRPFRGVEPNVCDDRNPIFSFRKSNRRNPVVRQRSQTSDGGHRARGAGT
jgi:hypothetical protein